VVVGQEQQPGKGGGQSSSQVHHPPTAQPRPLPLTSTGPPAQFPAVDAQAGYGSPGGVGRAPSGAHIGYGSPGGAGGVPSGMINSQGLLVGMRSPSVHPNEGIDGSTGTVTLQMATAPVLSESTATTGPLPSVFQAALPQPGTAGRPPQQQQQHTQVGAAGGPMSAAPAGLLPSSGIPAPQRGNVSGGAPHYPMPGVPQAFHDPAAAAGASAPAAMYAPQQHPFPQHQQQPGLQHPPVALGHVGTTSTVLQQQRLVLHQSIAAVLQSASNPATETGTHCTAPMFPQWPGLGPVPGQDLPSVTQLPSPNSVTIAPHPPPVLQHPTVVLPHASAQPAPLPLQPVVPAMPGSGMGMAGNTMPLHSHHPSSPGGSSTVQGGAPYAASYSSDVPYYKSFHSAPSVAGQGQGLVNPFSGTAEGQPYSPGGGSGSGVPQQYSQQQYPVPAGTFPGPVGNPSSPGPAPHGTILPGAVHQGAVQAAVPGSYPVPASGRASPPLVHHPSNASSFTLSPEREHLLPRPRTPITPHLGVDDGVVRAAAQSTSPRPAHTGTDATAVWVGSRGGGGGGGGGVSHPAASRGNTSGNTAHAAGRSHPEESESEAESDPGYTSTLSTMRGKETHIDMLVLDDARSSDDASLSQASDLRDAPTDRMAQKLSSRPEPWQHSTTMVRPMTHAPSSPARQPPEASESVGEQGRRHHGGAAQVLSKQPAVGAGGAANESKPQGSRDWGQLSSGGMGSVYDSRQVTLPQPGPSHSQTLSYTAHPGGAAWQVTTAGRSDTSAGVPPPTQSRSMVVLAPPPVMGNNTAIHGAQVPSTHAHPTWPPAQHPSGAVLQPALAPQVALTAPAQLQGYHSWGPHGVSATLAPAGVGSQSLVQVPIGMATLATQHATQSTQRGDTSWSLPQQYPGAAATLPAARPSHLPQNFQPPPPQQPPPQQQAVTSVPMQATEALARQAAAWAQSVGVSLPQPPPTLTGVYSTGGHTLGSTVSGSSTTRGGVLTTATLASPARHTSYTASSPLYNTGSSSASSAATLRPGVLPLGGSSAGSRAVPATAPAAILQHPQTAAQVGEAHVSQAYADTLQQLHAVYGGAHGSVGEGVGQPATSSAPSGSAAAAAAAGSRNLTSMWSGSFS
jgi:hypothetical protein